MSANGKCSPDIEQYDVQVLAHRVSQLRDELDQRALSHVNELHALSENRQLEAAESPTVKALQIELAQMHGHEASRRRFQFAIDAEKQFEQARKERGNERIRLCIDILNNWDDWNGSPDIRKALDKSNILTLAVGQLVDGLETPPEETSEAAREISNEPPEPTESELA